MPSQQRSGRAVFDGTTWVLGLLLIGVVCLQLYFGSRLDEQNRIVEQWELELLAQAQDGEPILLEPRFKPEKDIIIKKKTPRLALPPPHRHRVAMVIPYLGKSLPAWFRVFAISCRKSAELVDYLMFLADESAVPKEKDSFPDNIKFIVLGRRRFAKLHARAALIALDPTSKSNVSQEDDLTNLIEATFDRRPRQLVEFKPAIGVIFADYLKEYTHWAFGDLDLVVGDIGTIALDVDFVDFDVVTYSFGDQWRAYTRGQWTVHRNIRRVNLAYGSFCSYLTTHLLTRLQHKAHYESTEGCYSFALRKAEMRTRFAVTALTDATKPKDLTYFFDGEIRTCRQPDQVVAYESADCRPLAPVAWGTRDRMQARVEERRKSNLWTQVDLARTERRCMGWVNPRYQPCLAWDPLPPNPLKNSSYAGDYELILFANGSYARQFGTRDDFVRLDAAYRVWAFFHFQEWKKKYLSFSAQLPGPDGGYEARDFILDQNQNILRRVPRPDALANLVVTRFGFIPIPAARPHEPFAGARLRQDVDDAIPLAKIPRHYCAFKACNNQKRFIDRADLSLLFPVGEDDTDDDLLRDSHTEWWRPRFHKEAGVSLAIVLKYHDAVIEDSLISNACAWPGPLVAVLTLSASRSTKIGLSQSILSALRACRAQQTDKSTLVLGMRIQVNSNPHYSLKAGLNAALDATTTRFALALRNGELVSPNAYKAIVTTLKSLKGNAPSAPRGTTLVLPEFYVSPETGLTPASVSTGCGAKPPLSDAAYRLWSMATEEKDILTQNNISLFRKSLESPLARLDAAPTLVLDALDDRGDRRLVRELEELGGPGCYDAAYLRSLRLHHAANTTDDRFVFLVPGAFVFSRVNTTRQTCDDCPIATATIASDLTAYASFLETALDLRILADEESTLRLWDARRLAREVALSSASMGKKAAAATKKNTTSIPSVSNTTLLNQVPVSSSSTRSTRPRRTSTSSMLLRHRRQHNISKLSSSLRDHSSIIF